MTIEMAAMMSDETQFDIIQGITKHALGCIESGWVELVISYAVDDCQSDLMSSYLVDVNGKKVERTLATHPEILDKSFRDLRRHLADSSGQPFSTCRLHVWADGRFDSSYGYDEVDWSALVRVNSNFAP